MKHDDVDPLAVPTVPPNRDTEPELTPMQMFKEIRGLIRALDAKVETLSKNVDVELGQGQSVGKRVTELEGRVGKLEAQQLNGGSEHPAAV